MRSVRRHDRKIGSGQRLHDVAEVRRLSAHLVRKDPRMLIGAVGDEYRIRALVLDVLGDDRTHVPCADDGDGLAFETVELLLRQLDGCGTHRDCSAVELRLGPHPLAGVECLLEDHSEYSADVAFLLRIHVCVLHLALDLVLPDDEGVQSACHPEEMFDAGASLKYVPHDGTPRVRDPLVSVVLHLVLHPQGIGCRYVHLEPVARPEDEVLVHT